MRRFASRRFRGGVVNVGVRGARGLATGEFRGTNRRLALSCARGVERAGRELRRTLSPDVTCRRARHAWRAAAARHAASPEPPSPPARVGHAPRGSGRGGIEEPGAWALPSRFSPHVEPESSCASRTPPLASCSSSGGWKHRSRLHRSVRRFARTCSDAPWMPVSTSTAVGLRTSSSGTNAADTTRPGPCTRSLDNVARCCGPRRAPRREAVSAAACASEPTWMPTAHEP